jgi:CheY-like chemotaxis protein
MSKATAKTPSSKRDGKTVIFVVDDEALLLELACVILEPLGYELRTFRDPATALRAFTAAKPRPDLLLTDYAMHNMNGLNLIEACRRLEPFQRTALISGTIEPEFLNASKVKPDRFLAKPYQAKQLIDLVQSMLAE